MGKVEKYEKLNKPGLWFVCSGQPATELKQYVYDFAVESGLPIVVYSGIPKKEIQNSVIDLIKTKCIENAENENERDWLEQEMTEYDNHGFFWYPEELNDYVPMVRSGQTMSSLMRLRYCHSPIPFLTYSTGST